MAGAEIRIPMRSSDTEVQDQMRKLQTQVEMLTGKLRENSRTGRQGARELSQGADEASQGFQRFGRVLEGIQKKFLAIFSIETVQRFVTEMLEEASRLSQAADQSAMGMQRMLAATGFGAHADPIISGIRAMRAPMTESERAQVFGAIAGAAPRLSHEEVMALARPVIERGGAVHAGDAGIATQFGQAAADIYATGGFTAREAVDAAAFMHGAEGEHRAAETSRQMASMLMGIDPTLDPREAQGMAFGVVQAAAAEGFRPQYARASLEAFVSARDRVRQQGEQTALGLGYDPGAAAQFGRARMREMDASEFQRIVFDGTDEERARFLGRGASVPFHHSLDAFEYARAGVMNPRGALARIPLTPEAEDAIRRKTGTVAGDIAQEQHRGVARQFVERRRETEDLIRRELPGLPSTVSGAAAFVHEYWAMFNPISFWSRTLPDTFRAPVDVNIRVDNQNFLQDTTDELSTPN